MTVMELSDRTVIHWCVCFAVGPSAGSSLSLGLQHPIRSVGMLERLRFSAVSLVPTFKDVEPMTELRSAMNLRLPTGIVQDPEAGIGELSTLLSDRASLLAVDGYGSVRTELTVVALGQPAEMATTLASAVGALGVDSWSVAADSVADGTSVFPLEAPSTGSPQRAVVEHLTRCARSIGSSLRHGVVVPVADVRMVRLPD